MPTQNEKTDFSLPETFMQQVNAARNAAMEAGMRHVTYEISYLLPDNPHVIGLPFIHFLEGDYFTAGENLTKRIDDLIRRSTTLLDEEKANQIAKEFTELADEMRIHLQRIENTADEFVLPFKGLTANQRAEAIDEVPLKKLRDFLKFWEREIDGPLEQVKVALEKMPPSDLTLAFLKSSTGATDFQQASAKAKTLIGVKPSKPLLN